VYVRTSVNSLAYVYWNNSWSNWANPSSIGLVVAGDPAVLYNPRSATTRVYVRSGAGRVTYCVYTLGWSCGNDIGGSITGNPAPLYNPRFGTGEVYANSAGSAIYRYYNSASVPTGTEAWSDWIGLA
jgi:hypothetical protein